MLIERKSKMSKLRQNPRDKSSNLRLTPLANPKGGRHWVYPIVRSTKSREGRIDPEWIQMAESLGSRPLEWGFP
jgi:hypothetical protein